MYKVIWDRKAAKDLSKIDISTAKRIYSQVNIELSINPLVVGKELKGHFKGARSYRIGDYRVIYAVDCEIVTVEVIKVAHRKEVYIRI
jgi:mRNA interferase RelE/StbE